MVETLRSLCLLAENSRDHQIETQNWQNGARYRVRTCDPYRVKVMLYH